MSEAAPAALAPIEVASASEVSRVEELLEEDAVTQEPLEQEALEKIRALREKIIEEAKLLRDVRFGKLKPFQEKELNELILKLIREEQNRIRMLGDPETKEETTEEAAKKQSQAKYPPELEEFIRSHRARYQQELDEFIRRHRWEGPSESSEEEQDILLEIAVRVCQFACVCVCGVYRRFYMHAVRAVSTAVCTCTRYPCFLSTRAVSTAIFHARMHRL